MPGRKHQQVVMRLFDAITDNDRDRVLSFFTDQSIFQSPDAVEPAVGHTAIWSALSASGACGQAVEHKLCRVGVAPDGSVQAERIQRCLVDGEWCELHFTGVLAVEGCKITRWTEHSAAPMAATALG